MLNPNERDIGLDTCRYLFNCSVDPDNEQRTAKVRRRPQKHFTALQDYNIEICNIIWRAVIVLSFTLSPRDYLLPSESHLAGDTFSTCKENN